MKLIRFVTQRMKGARATIVAALLVGVVSGASSVGLLVLINAALDGTAMPIAVSASLLFILLCVVVTVTRVMSQYLLERLGQCMVMGLRLELSRDMLRTPLRRLETLGLPRLLVALTDDINTITRALINLPVLCINGTIVAGCFGYLAWVNVRLFLMMLAAVAVGLASYQIPAQLGMRRFQEARDKQNELFSLFRALGDGIKELKLNRQRRRGFLELMTGILDQVRRRQISATLIFGAASSWGHLLFFVVIGVLLFARPAFIGTDPGTLVGYTIVVLYMMSPLQSLLDSFPSLARAEVAVRTVEKLGLELADVEPSTPVDALGAPAFRRLELRGVRCSYRREGQEDDFSLGPLHLTLEPGEILFLVGGNGSGKTTLAKLITGLYAPESGSILVDDTPVPDHQTDAYRQLFSAVFGDFYLFERLLGLEAPELDKTARRYLEQLEIDHKVSLEGDTLTTTELSQGQRKRLALLVAYLEDRPIYVFDEWAADQDPVFKEIFYRKILSQLKMRGKAVVVISHDDRYFEVADRIIKLEDGQLAYQGTDAARAAMHRPLAGNQA